MLRKNKLMKLQDYSEKFIYIYNYEKIVVKKSRNVTRINSYIYKTLGHHTWDDMFMLIIQLMLS